MMHSKIFRPLSLVLCAALSMSMLQACAAEPDHYTVYFGTYTRGKSKGIYVHRMDAKTGKLTPVSVAETSNPSFLALHPSGDYLYACGEMSNFQGKKAGAVSAFAVDKKTGSLTLLNQQSSVGGGPCHVDVPASGTAVLVANYGGGSVASLPIKPNGSLGEAVSFVQHTGTDFTKRQSGPHAHCVNFDATGKFIYAADLGLDKILIYRFDSKTGKIAPADPPFAKTHKAAGPRHFAIHPNQKSAYVINEIDKTVTAFKRNTSTGELTTLQTLSTVPEGVTGGSTAELFMHPSGKFLYGSNRGHDSIAIFKVNASTGMLTAVGHESTQGKTPRSFGISPCGKFLLAANQQSDTVVVFRIDQSTGQLKATGQVVEVPVPVCVVFK